MKQLSHIHSSKANLWVGYLMSKKNCSTFENMVKKYVIFNQKKHLRTLNSLKQFCLPIMNVNIEGSNFSDKFK